MVTYCCRRFLHWSRLRFHQDAILPSKIRKPTKNEDKATDSSKFVDWLRVLVKAGDGGDGGVSLLSLAKNEFAGPDGGNGGNGGHVIFQATSKRNSFNHLKSKITAPNGVSGGQCDMEGKNANHLIIEVPVGTVFRNMERQVVAEIENEGSMFLAARGGEGGKGNAFFKAADRQKPLVAEKGGPGECFSFDIGEISEAIFSRFSKPISLFFAELRTMADVGLIGFPNAGKSTLLRAISRARPKVAAYPFTTLVPHIGMVPYNDGVQLAVADIPGIIEDAHKNKGLGISFLRHIERCKCLLYVLDMAQSAPVEQFQCLTYELEQYSPGLSSRPHAIIANKMDLAEAKSNLEHFQSWLISESKLNSRLIAISAQEKSNTLELVSYIRQLSSKS